MQTGCFFPIYQGKVKKQMNFMSKAYFMSVQIYYCHGKRAVCFYWNLEV